MTPAGKAAMNDVMIESQPHAARLTIDTGALAANYRLLAARAAPAETAAVVKANAYGTGIEAAVPALLKAGCRTFFVAHLAEAARVRALSREATVYALNGLPVGTAAKFAEMQIRPVIGSLAELAEWQAAGAPCPAALHVDTGMNRLGFRPEELAGLDLTAGRIALVMTHFVSSETPDAPINARQRAAFAAVRRAIPDLPFSMSNSSGFFHHERLPVEQFRAGYALYGGNPCPGSANPMQPVVRLEAPILQIRRVPKGESVGYNQRWTARRDSIIATISLGYADGYPRNGANTDDKPGGMARIGGILCPFAGNVSMDLITVDVTDVPLGLVQRGAWIAVIDEVLDVDRVGASCGTIGYEILTSLGDRFQRVTVGS